MKASEALELSKANLSQNETNLEECYAIIIEYAKKGFKKCIMFGMPDISQETKKILRDQGYYADNIIFRINGSEVTIGFLITWDK